MMYGWCVSVAIVTDKEKGREVIGRVMRTLLLHYTATIINVNGVCMCVGGMG